HPETVAHPGRNEDEGASRAHFLSIVQEHDVFAFEHVERLGSVVVDVKRRPEMRRLVRFEEREDSVRLVGVRLDGHREDTEVDRSSFTVLSTYARLHLSPWSPPEFGGRTLS